jgi:hypothetical protein
MDGDMEVDNSLTLIPYRDSHPSIERLAVERIHTAMSDRTCDRVVRVAMLGMIRCSALRRFQPLCNTERHVQLHQHCVT